MSEKYFLSGTLEETNDAYAVAKIAGIKMCQAYKKQYDFDAVSIVPTNMYGLNDKYTGDNAHVVPALLKRIHEAKISKASEVVIWGTGTPMREFLYSEDCADAILFSAENYQDDTPLNIGTGADVHIYELVSILSEVVGYKGAIVWDKTKPDGVMRKLLDCTLINNLGWSHKVDLRDGLERMYEDFLKNI